MLIWRLVTASCLLGHEGASDIENRILRHVGPGFSEDPLQVLRVARIAAHLPDCTVAPDTLQLMQRMSAAGKLWSLLKELDAFRNPQHLERFLIVCEADARGRKGFEQRPYPQAERMRLALRVSLEVQGSDILQQGHAPGPKIGEMLRQCQIERIKEALRFPQNADRTSGQPPLAR